MISRAFFVLLWLAVTGSTLSFAQCPSDPKQVCPEPPTVINGIDLEELGKRLERDGLTGWIHGAAHDLNEYVFTYREADFFTAVHLSVVPANAQVLAALRKVHRNDQVFIRGEFQDNPSAQKHILLTAVTVMKKFDPGIQATPYQREVKIPDELMGKSELVGAVHAIVADGQILVIEFKDAVLPVFVSDTSVTKHLYRGDKVRLAYTLLKHPKKPTHLLLDTRAAKPIEVLESLAQHSGEPWERTGALVMFPKSPEIIFNVYALQEADSDGVKRNYTLVGVKKVLNADGILQGYEFDMDLFKAIRDKLEAAWAQHQDGVKDDRNKFLNTKIKVHAKGILNQISPSQANPQIYLESLDAVEVLTQ